jgi:hypothetical protein
MCLRGETKLKRSRGIMILAKEFTKVFSFCNIKKGELSSK